MPLVSTGRIPPATVYAPPRLPWLSRDGCLPPVPMPPKTPADSVARDQPQLVDRLSEGETPCGPMPRIICVALASGEHRGGSSSVGRASAFQAECRGFEPRLPLHRLTRPASRSALHRNPPRNRRDVQDPGHPVYPARNVDLGTLAGGGRPPGPVHIRQMTQGSSPNRVMSSGLSIGHDREAFTTVTARCHDRPILDASSATSADSRHAVRPRSAAGPWPASRGRRRRDPRNRCRDIVRRAPHRAIGAGRLERRPPRRSPSASGWSLVELQRHVEAGEVTAITAAQATGTVGPAGPTLLVRTKDGQVIPIDLTVTPGEAVIGPHGARLRQPPDDRGARGSAGRSRPDSGVNILGIVLPIAILVFTLMLVMRMSRRNGSGPRDSSSFRTIMPRCRTERTATLEAAVVDPLAVAVRLDDVAGCDEAKLELTETIEFLRSPGAVPQAGRADPARDHAVRPSRHRQDDARPGRRRRGRRPVPPRVRLGVRREVRRRRRAAGPRPVRPGPQARPRRHLLRRVRRHRQGPRRPEQPRGARADAQPAARRARRLRHDRGRHRHRRDEPARHARPGRPPPGPLQPQDPCRPARRRRPQGDPRGPRPEQADRDDDRSRGHRPQDLRLLRRDARRPPQRGRDPGRPPRPARRSSPRTSTAAG